jgi:hypothetical protein
MRRTFAAFETLTSGSFVDKEKRAH